MNLNKHVSTTQILEFEVAFPDEQPLTVEEYLKGGERDIVLQTVALLLSFPSLNDNEEVLSKIFGDENTAFANKVYDKIKATEVKIEITNTYSSLKLFEVFFSKETEVVVQTDAEFERNLFKAYLVLNSEYTERQNTAEYSTKNLNTELVFPAWMFCAHYPVSDKENYNIEQISVTQIIKAIYLFEFLSENTKTQPLLEAFLSSLDCQTWKSYLKKFLPLVKIARQGEPGVYPVIVVPRDEKFEENCKFIEKIILQNSDELDEYDFKSLRAKPIYKTGDGTYRIIFNLFVVEKIFKGLYFILRDVYKNFPKNNKMLGDFRGFYCDEFSEKILLYKVVESIYSDKYIRFSGEEFKDQGMKAEPDYYIRKGKNIILFESKDFLISADKKALFDFNVYEEAFQRVLYYEELSNGKEKAGAVMQLINNIRRILKNELHADTNYNYRKVCIYPVLIIHDRQYDVVGFNNLVDDWFQDELVRLQEEGLSTHCVKPLTVVNIDSLIFHKVGLAKSFLLHEVLKAYATHRKIKLNEIPKSSVREYQAYMSAKLLPFSEFIDHFFLKKGIWKIPSSDVVKDALFADS